ncbi:unnamed protein product [Eruca vesicaria subsp. sativa]|uniref:AIG1-type G domain-containing protein n=1 Tax=Eruca vesicaria subsp. sativa TaxID=29727 RepID=A0ABC8J7W6_ERUVS|nr:unnamed protein product [Eruca vesicaria subsp. sativa]
MEREKQLRGISIIAAEAVNPEKSRGIAIPAVRAVVADALLLTRSLSGTFSSAGSVPIRAPVTLDEEDDDDDDDGSVTEERNLDDSGYSKGIDSGSDDGFESVTGDAEEEGLVMDELRAHGVVLGEESVGENGDGSDFSGGSVVLGPLGGGDVEEEASVNKSSLEEESENEVSEADEDGMKAKVVIPRASLSLEDDEVLGGGSGDEETVLMRVTRAPGDEEGEVEDRMLEFEDVGMVDEPEYSGSVLTDVVSEDEAVEMKVTGLLEDGSNDLMVENEASIGLDGSSKQLVEEGVVNRTTIKEDGGGGSIHESDALMEPGDVEGVGDNAVELGEREMTVLSEGSGTGTGELVSTEEDMVQVNPSDDASVSFETGLVVAPEDCSEFVVESQGNAVDADEGLDETYSKLVEQGVGQESVSKESDNKVVDGSACEVDEPVIQGEESVGLGSRESEDEDTRFMIGEGNELTENACSAVGKLEKPECEEELEIGMTSESSQVTPTTVDSSVTTKNLEIPQGMDVAVSGCDSSNQKDGQETENEGTQESEDIDMKLSLPDEDRASSLSSFQLANQSVEDGEQIDKQVSFQSVSELNQISVAIEETSLVSVKDVERTMPENSCVTENETQISQLIHNDTCMELDDYEGTCDTKEKHSEPTFQNHSEESSSDHSLQLISGRVKERIEKTKLIKEKIQKIIKGIDLCNEDSPVTEDESQESLVSEEHHTSLELDDHRTKTNLPEQEFPLDLDLSINVLVIGKTGVGKSATINSIFGETKSAVNAFEVTTKSAHYVVGNVGGILITILDTPGLLSSATEERYNQEVLMKIKKSMRRFPVDVVLYIDRLDENPDIRLLRTITTSLGSAIWQNAIVVLTHAASDVVSDSSSYIAQRCSLMHQAIREAAPELSCVEPSKMPGIVLAENRKTTCQDWRLKLLILCCSVKIRCKGEQSNTLVEKPDGFGSFTLFCSLWNVLVLGSNQGQACHSLAELEEQKRRLLESYPEIFWDEQSLEQETLKNQDEERRHEEESVRRRGRRGSFGFQATKRLGIYLDTCDVHTGFSMGSSRSGKVEAEEGKMLVRMRSSLSVLGAVHLLASVITYVYGRKGI